MPIVTKKSSVKTPSRASNAVSRIQSLSFDDNSGLKVLVYGRSGTGKTTFWGTFPGPILAIVCSGGDKKPGELRSLNTAEYRKKIKHVSLERSEELIELTEYAEKSGSFKTLVLDHVTDFQNLRLKEILGYEELPEQLSWGTASQQQYGQLTLEVKELLRRFLNFAEFGNVVIVGQERTRGEESGGTDINPIIHVSLTPSLAGWLAPACDYVVNSFIKQREVVKRVTVNGKVSDKLVEVPGEVDFCLRTGPDPIYTTKFRLPRGKGTPKILVDPTYEKFAKLLKDSAT